MSDIQIAVAYHKNSEIIENDCLLPIQVGRACSDIELNIQGDDTGDNISEKNFGYAELTAIYWLWKNSDAKIKGLFHYRRFLDLSPKNKHANEEIYELPITKDFSSSKFLKQIDISESNIKSLLNKYTLLTRNREDLHVWSNYSVKSHYAAMHHGEHLDQAMKIIKRDWPEYYQTAKKLLNGHTSYFANVFIMRNREFNEYCSFMFDILFKIEPTLNLYDKTLAPNTTKARWAGFLGERLTAIYIQKQIDDGKKVGEFPLVILTTGDNKPWFKCNTYDTNLYVAKQAKVLTIPNGKQPIISVCISAYNVGKFIGKCLESVTNQTLQNIEIIVVNDGSVDNTLDIINKYAAKDKRIVIIDQKNQGVGCTRNNAIKIATGKYIHMMDGDDYMDTTFLENMVKNAERYNSDLVLSTHQGVEEESSKSLYVSTLPHTLLKDKLNISNNIDLLLVPCHVWDKIYKKSLIQDIPFTSEGGEDIYFWYRTILKVKNASIHRSCEYNYRICTKSVQSNPNYVLGVFKNLERSEQLIHSTNNDDIISMFNLFKEILIGHIMFRAHMLIVNNNTFRKQFFHNIKKILTHNKINKRLQNRKDWFLCDFALIEKIKKCNSIKEFDRLVIGRPIKSLFVNTIKLAIAPRHKKNKYHARITETYNKIQFPLKFKLFGMTLAKVSKKGSSHKFYLCRIPLFKINTNNETLRVSLLGLALYYKNRIKTKLFGITIRNTIDTYLMTRLNQLQESVNNSIRLNQTAITKADEIRAPCHATLDTEPVATNAKPSRSKDSEKRKK